jgi:hypothetical protein
MRLVRMVIDFGQWIQETQVQPVLAQPILTQKLFKTF